MLRCPPCGTAVRITEWIQVKSLEVCGQRVANIEKDLPNAGLTVNTQLEAFPPECGIVTMFPVSQMRTPRPGEAEELALGCEAGHPESEHR